MTEATKFISARASGETIVLGTTQWVDFIVDSSLRDCTIIIRSSARGVAIGRSAFHKCTIHAKKPLLNVQWTDCVFEDCVFLGKYIGAEFGYRPLSLSNVKGSVTRCDFSSAHLDFCRFNTCDPAQLRLPSWPYFTVVNPRSSALALPESSPNRELACWRRLLLDEPAETAGVTFHGPQLAKTAAVELTEIQALVFALPGVIR